MKRSVITIVCVLVSILTFAQGGQEPVSMASYEQGWMDDFATIALKNNTDKPIRNVTFELTYLDMNGDAMDYEQYSVNVDIEPGRTKKTNVPAYEDESHYHYYATPDGEGHPKFKVKYELKRYNSDIDHEDEGSELSSPSAWVVKADSTSVDKGLDRLEGWLTDGVSLIILLLCLLIFLGMSVGLYILVAILARNRHRSVLLWVLLSILASPVVIAIILLVIGEAKDGERAL